MQRFLMFQNISSRTRRIFALWAASAVALVAIFAFLVFVIPGLLVKASLWIAIPMALVGLWLFRDAISLFRIILKAIKVRSKMR